MKTLRNTLFNVVRGNCDPIQKNFHCLENLQISTQVKCNAGVSNRENILHFITDVCALDSSYEL